MDADFPAAHSMDTTWFAVDKDGRVGYFESGEAGAVPVEALQGESAHSMLMRLANALPRSEVLQDRQGRWLPKVEGRHEHRSSTQETITHVLLFLKSLDLVADHIAAGRARQLASTSDFAVYFWELPAELAARLHDSNVCMGCFWHWLASPDQAAEQDRVEPETFGFFQYDHLCENWISGPYGRTTVPANPVHVDQLPPQLRNALKAVQFNVNFAETPHIQPVAEHECASWENQWLDLDGKDHPMPGREDEIADEE
jgi:hypothetical protein